VKAPQLFQKPAFRHALAGFICAVGLFGLYRVGTPVVEEFRGSFAMKEFKQYGVYGTYKRHFFSFVDRLDEFAILDRENRQLNKKLAELEKDQILGDAARATRDLASLNETLEESLKNEAGSELAIALHSIKYEVPSHLAVHQLHALAVGHFRREDHEKAARVLHHLLGLKDDPQFRKPENYLMSGISWFHLKNFNLALRDFRESIRLSPKGEAAHRKTMFWQALCYRSLGKKTQAENTMLHFIELYPGSEEADWLNGKRRPASESSHETVPPAAKEASHHGH